MHKPLLPAIGIAFAISAGQAGAEEILFTCAWDRGGKFDLQINDRGVVRNGHKASDEVTINEQNITWHEVSLSTTEYEYNVNRRTGG